MTTDLKRFNEAYATMTVAAYEPMILHWISLIGIRFISNEVAYRQAKSDALKLDGKMPAGLALGQTVRKPLPPRVTFNAHPPPHPLPIDVPERPPHPTTINT